MSDRVQFHAALEGIGTCRTFALVVAALTLSGCAELGGVVGPASLLSFSDGSAAPVDASLESDPQKAAEHWSKEYAKEPNKVENAVNYAKHLKALGQKTQAIAILQRASMVNNGDKSLASEYGRLALELDQVSTAKQLLEIADDPINPDWRIVLARGTVLAKEGRYSEAITFYERARTLAPDHPSVMNNLALAYTMSGEPAKGEEMLRQAAAVEGARGKVRQNLALVLGIQGKYDEAKAVGSAELPADTAAANTDLLRKMVKAEPRGTQPVRAALNEVEVEEEPRLPPVKAARKEVEVEPRLPPVLKASADDQNDEPRADEPAKVATTAQIPAFKPTAR